MIHRKIEIYVDLKFLEGYFKNLNACDTLSEEFEVYYSFFKIIQQDHVRLISLESGKEIKAIDIRRVYQSTFKFDDPIIEKYNIDKEFYLTARNPQSIFFGEVYKEDQNELKKKYGFVFSCNANFVENWSRLLLINIRSTIHVKFGFSWSDLKPYALPSNSILFIEPYIMSWLQKEVKKKVGLKLISYNPRQWRPIEFKVTDNLDDAISAISTSITCTSLKIITKSDNRDEGDQGASNENIAALLDKIKSKISVSIESFENGALKSGEMNVRKTKEAAMADLQNLLHDRYIITNYHMIISTHSLDLVDRESYNNEKLTRKNTQLIIQPLLQADYFDFYLSKLEDYSSILAWRSNQILKRFVLSEAKGEAINRHFHNRNPPKLEVSA